MKKKERTLVAFDSQDFKILESERELLAIKGGKAGWSFFVFILVNLILTFFPIRN